MYEYKMVQIPPGIKLTSKNKGSEAADYLEKVVEKYASLGWEFHRIDSFGIETSAGCLGALMGASGEQQEYYVISFRKERTESDSTGGIDL